jgi:hypothetical protein
VRGDADNQDMRPSSVRAAAAVAGVLALGCVMAPAGAAEQQSESSLVLTMYEGTAGTGPVIAEVTLKCDPTGGSHTTADDACATVDAVDGDFDALGSTGEMCILIYDPVTVEVGGNWRDQVISFESAYGNSCFAGTESDGVFKF